MKTIIHSAVVLPAVIAISGCGPSESQVRADFERMARRGGVPISGGARASKMHRVRVDGQRKDVWRVDYDVPNYDGTKTWKKTYMTYENGKPKVIRTDVEGRVR